jgi:cell wall assembly regulator SMI1
MSEIEKTWERVESWLAMHAPRVRAGLMGPVAEPVLANAESVFGRALPADFVASLRRHDGQRSGSGFGRWELMSLSDATDTWKMLHGFREQGGIFDDSAIPTHGPVRAVWWDDAWFPFADNGRGDHLSLDLHPADGGAHGQVIEYRHDNENRHVRAPSFAAWLASIADDLEADRFEVLLDGEKIRRRR